MALDRHARAPRLKKNGQLKPLVFNDGHLEMVKLLSPVKARDPWSYQYLPVRYVPALLGQSLEYGRKQVTWLASEPWNYLHLPEQSEIYSCPLIVSVGKEGKQELRHIGVSLPNKPLRPIPHELLACISAASFEYGAKQHGFKIEVVEREADVTPDWPVFKLTGEKEHIIFLEADMGRESLTGDASNTITSKLLRYAQLFENYDDLYAVFVTTRPSRVTAMAYLARKLPRSVRSRFLFTSIKYNRFLTKIPPLTDWAISGEWKTAYGTFSFLKKQAAEAA